MLPGAVVWREIAGALHLAQRADGSFVQTNAAGKADCCCGGCPPEKPPCCCTVPPTCADPSFCNPTPPPHCVCGPGYASLGAPGWFSFVGSANYTFTATCSFPNEGVRSMSGTSVLAHTGPLIRSPSEYCQAFGTASQSGSLSLGFCPGFTPDPVARSVILEMEGKFGKTGGFPIFNVGGKIRVRNTKDVSDYLAASFIIDTLGNISFGQDPPPSSSVTGGIVFNPSFQGGSLVGFGANGSVRVDRGGGWVSNYVVSAVIASSGPWYPCGSDAPASGGTKGPCLGCGDRVLTS